MSQTQQQPSRVVGVVWEGEWPAVKNVVRMCRNATQFTYGFLHDALYFPGATSAVNRGMQSVDDSVHRSSLFVAQYLNQTSPWLPQATAVTAATAIASVKSYHYWGAVAGARNGVVMLAVTSLLMFPDEITQAVFPAEKKSAAKQD
jgi:hypothetical protein